MISILFLAADPTDASRLRLGEEAREIHEKLRLSKERKEFELHQRLSVRPEDISQALLDTTPAIVHFSGHGTSIGSLCFENKVGEVHPVSPDALGALFEHFTDSVNCVILNACFSAVQANAISKYIPFVIGMNKAIGDEAAIAFSIGFYQALGAGRSIEDAYKLGCVQIRLNNIPEHLTPILLKRKSTIPLSDIGSQTDLTVDFDQRQRNSILQIPLSQFRKHLAIDGHTGTGKSSTLNWITAKLWEKHRIPFFAIRHWQGLTRVSRQAIDQIVYHCLENPRPLASEENATEGSHILDSESKIISRFEEIQNCIAVEQLSKYPTILDVALKNWNDTEFAFQLIWNKLIENTTFDLQTDQLRFVVVVDELDEIAFPTIRYDPTVRYEISKHLRILRKCGIGVIFTTGTRSTELIPEVRNLIVFPRSELWKHPSDELRVVEKLRPSLKPLGEAVLMSRGVVSPTVISIPDVSSELHEFWQIGRV